VSREEINNTQPPHHGQEGVFMTKSASVIESETESPKQSSLPDQNNRARDKISCGHNFLKGSFVSTRLDPARIDKYNKKIVIATIRDPDLFHVGNQFTHGMGIKRLGINPLVKRCGINLTLWFLVILIMMR
jgi:hypothetical protein